MSIGALIEKFRTVALDRIERMNLAMVTLERDPQDSAACEELLREIHTLKGEAKMMGFADINLVAHQTESLLMHASKHNFDISKESTNYIFEGFDIIRALLTKRTGASETPVDLSEFVEHIALALLDLSNTSVQEGPPKMPAEPDLQKALTVEVDPEQLFELASMSPGAPPESSTMMDIPLPTKSARVNAAQLTELSDLGAQRSSDFGRRNSTTGMLRIQTENTLRVRFDRLERIGDISSEVILMSRRLDFHLVQLERVRDEFKDWMQLVEFNLPKSHFSAIRDLSHKIDSLLTASVEDNHLVHLRSSQLDDEVRSLRHIPFVQAISHYPRAVRDLAESQGKRVRFAHEVGDIEVDRPVLSKLSEPLLHLVRNAVDHGIESPQERATLEKHVDAEIYLSAEHIGDSLRVILQDNGRGIDPEFVKRRAVEKGVVSQEEADALTDQDALILIFEPGFSTKSSVSDVSGRGIGLDIVLRQITSAGGVVEVESEIHKGTTFTLLVPLSSSVISVLLIEIGNRTFGLHAKDIDYVDTVSRHEITKVHDASCVRIDGELTSLLDWRAELGVPLEGLPPDQMRVLVVSRGTRRVAIWVNRIIGERDALNRPLGDFFHGIRVCRGIAITDTGSLVPLLNVTELLTRTSSQDVSNTRSRIRSGKNIPKTSQLREIKTILVAEDSEITRSLVTSILRSMGHRVLEAEDGQEAWEIMQEHRVNLVMTDVQMPRMSGLELLQHLRSDERFINLPIVVLTTLGSTQDKERAMILGADAYLTKLDFREQDLVSTIQRYLYDT